MSNFQVDSDNVLKMLENCNLDNHKDEVRNIINECLSKTYQRANTNLHSMLTQRGKNKYGLKLSDGIRKCVWKNNEGGTVWVSQQGNYITYMQATGNYKSKPRMTKKKANRGNITAKPFFQNAVSATENEVIQHLHKRLSDLINNIK